MKKGYCHILAIIDRSGSMSCIKNEVIGGFNAFVSDQRKAEGTATMTLVQFDNMYEVNYDFMDIDDVPDLNEDTYIPRGMTAMLDAVGMAIISTGQKISDMEEINRPEKVVVLIQTDGMENASHEYTSDAIKKMIEEQTDVYSWDFVFLGANIDAVHTACNIGIKSGMSMNFVATGTGAKSALNSVSENLTNYRCGVKSDMSYEDKDYKAQSDAGVSV